MLTFGVDWQYLMFYRCFLRIYLSNYHCTFPDWADHVCSATLRRIPSEIPCYLPYVFSSALVSCFCQTHSQHLCVSIRSSLLPWILCHSALFPPSCCPYLPSPPVGTDSVHTIQWPPTCLSALPISTSQGFGSVTTGCSCSFPQHCHSFSIPIQACCKPSPRLSLAEDCSEPWRWQRSFCEAWHQG